LAELGNIIFLLQNLENNEKKLEIIAKLLKPQIWKEVDFFFVDAKFGKN